MDTSVKLFAACISVVHPSLVDVGSVSLDISTKKIALLGGLLDIRYPPLRTTSPSKQVAVELALEISKGGITTELMFGPNCL